MEVLLKLNNYDKSKVEFWEDAGYGFHPRTLYCVADLESFRCANFFDELSNGEDVICTIEKKED